MKAEKDSNPGEYRTYLLVWLALVILTGITYAAATSEGMGLVGLAVPTALVIAGTKSGLVLAYFMHLRSEKERIFKVIIPLVIAVLLVFIGLTFSDIAIRYER